MLSMSPSSYTNKPLPLLCVAMNPGPFRFKLARTSPLKYFEVGGKTAAAAISLLHRHHPLAVSHFKASGWPGSIMKGCSPDHVIGVFVVCCCVSYHITHSLPMCVLIVPSFV